MNGAADSLGIIVISHGSPRLDVNLGFVGLVERVASRLGMANLLPAFFGKNRQPDINMPVQLGVLASRGVRRVVMLPYFLYSGHHVTVDIPAALQECRQLFPEISMEMLGTLEQEFPIEDMLVERLASLAGMGGPWPGDGPAIEQRSYEIIERRLGDGVSFADDHREIVRRIIHATADLSFARTLRIHPEAVDRGRAALAAGKPIVCDVKMLQAGLTKIRGEVLCAVDQAEAAAQAEEKGSTRAAAGMELLAPRWNGAIVAIGNAPTALWKVLELASRGGPRPALVVGLPVGFVGAADSKRALLESDLCHITNTGARGGSPAAAAAVNALVGLIREH